MAKEATDLTDLTIAIQSDRLTARQRRNIIRKHGREFLQRPKANL